MTRTPNYAFLEHSGVLAFAHRGDHSGGPENTFSAFDAAVKKGFIYLETDVHVSADGVVLAFHDETLDRTTNQTGRIDALGYREISRARIGANESIPRLDVLLEAFPCARFNIDPKSDAVVEPLISLLRHCRAQERVCIGSFSDRRLRHVRTKLPKICTSMGPLEVALQRFSGLFSGSVKTSAGCAQVPPKWGPLPVVDARFIEQQHRNGRQVHVWTVNDRAQMHRLLDLGVDGLMTDFPSVLREVLQDRGQW